MQEGARWYVTIEHVAHVPLAFTPEDRRVLMTICGRRFVIGEGGESVHEPKQSQCAECYLVYAL